MTSPADTLTVQQLDHLTGLLAAATAGPWVQMLGDVYGLTASEPRRHRTVAVGPGGAQMNEHNAALIVEAVNALPALLATVRRQQAALDAAHRLCADYEGGRADLDAWDVVEQVRALASPAPTEATT